MSNEVLNTKGTPRTFPGKFKDVMEVSAKFDNGRSPFRLF